MEEYQSEVIEDVKTILKNWASDFDWDEAKRRDQEAILYENGEAMVPVTIELIIKDD